MLKRFLARMRSRLSGSLETKAQPPATAIEIAEQLISEGNRAESKGDIQAASESYQTAVAVAPEYAKAHLNLGIALEAIGDTDRALRSFKAALEIDPEDEYANYNSGRILFTRGAFDEAQRLLNQAIQRKPDFSDARVVLASILDNKGDPGAAASELELALRERPEYFGALCNYAQILKKLGRLEEAEAALRRVVALEPDNERENCELATLLIERGKPGDSERFIVDFRARKPESVAACSVLLRVYQSQGKLAAAAAVAEATLKLRPDWVDLIYNYGLVLKQLKRLAEAEAAFRRLIAIEPTYEQAYRLLGSVLQGQCRIDEALRTYAEGRRRCGDSVDLGSAELFALNCADDVSIDDLYARHAAFGARLEQSLTACSETFGNTRDPERRLRVGYVSAEFRYHVVTLFLLPLLERYDRSVLEVYCYSTGDTVDEFTKDLRERTDVWRDASSMSSQDLAALIQRDQIDILVDLAGHSGVQNLPVFARRPAPIQVTWLGYLFTTGLTRIDYRISDRYCDPPGLTDKYHTEKLIYLPHSQWCYRPFITIDCEDEPPLVRAGHVTFGSFNQAVKLSRTVRVLWSEILNRLPDSRLVIVGIDQGRAREDLYRDMESAGVRGERITVIPHVSLEDYFSWFGRIDIALDTIPYSGGTTSCDAIWMGVPVVTAPGVRPCSRSAASVLMTVGLAEWIASSHEDYVRKAVEFAGAPAVLARLRRSLRTRMRESPLMDETGFARDMEETYRSIWRNWCLDAGGSRC